MKPPIRDEIVSTRAAAVSITSRKVVTPRTKVSIACRAVVIPMAAEDPQREPARLLRGGNDRVRKQQ
jgi:hypothetical protein